MIYLKTPTQIEKIEYSNKVGSELLQACRDRIRVGTSTFELEEMAQKFCSDNGIRPSFKGYKGYPFCLCVSVNEEVVHGFPGDRTIEDGDIVSVDFGVEIDGYYSDAAFTKTVGNVSENTRKLVEVTERCLRDSVNKAVHNGKLFDISKSIQDVAEENEFNAIRTFGGHGVGFDVHESPFVFNYMPDRGCNYLLKAGMVLAIEPMVAEGSYETEVVENGWTAVTKDRRKAAHFERSVAIMPEGPKILADF
jgi:methionyl aminopeptidase